MMLLENSNYDSSQKSSILAATAPKDTKMSLRLSMEDLIKCVEFETFESEIL